MLTDAEHDCTALDVHTVSRPARDDAAASPASFQPLSKSVIVDCAISLRNDLGEVADVEMN